MLSVDTNKKLTKGHSGLRWELQASVSADGFQGHISPEEMKEVAAKITEGDTGLTRTKMTTQTHLKRS